MASRSTHNPAHCHGEWNRLTVPRSWFRLNPEPPNLNPQGRKSLPRLVWGLGSRVLGFRFEFFEGSFLSAWLEGLGFRGSLGSLHQYLQLGVW